MTSHRKPQHALNIVGQRFGKLLVVEQTENSKCGHTRWVCLCECGNRTIEFGSYLRSGRANDCGCITKRRTWRNKQEPKEISPDVRVTISPNSLYAVMIGSAIVAEGSARSIFDDGWDYALKNPGVTVDIYSCQNGKPWKKLRSYNAGKISPIINEIKPYLNAEW